MPLTISRPQQLPDQQDLQGEPLQQRGRAWDNSSDRPRQSETIEETNNKVTRLDRSRPPQGISTTTRLAAENQEPLREREKFDDVNQHKGAFGGLRDFASQKWDQLAHGDHKDQRDEQPRERYERFTDRRFDPLNQETQFERYPDQKTNKFQSFKLTDNWRRATSPLQPRKEEEGQKSLWERAKEKGEEWKEDVKEWKDERTPAQRYPTRSDAQRAYEEQRALDDRRTLQFKRGNESATNQRWVGDDPLDQFEKQPRRMAAYGDQASLRQRDDDLSGRRSLRTNQDYPIQNLHDDLPGQANRRDQESRTVQQNEEQHKKGLWGFLKEKKDERNEAKEWKDAVAKKQTVQPIDTPTSNVDKVDDLVRGAPYQRASAQSVWDDWWHRQQQYGQDWETMKGDGRMFKQPEHKLQPAFMRLPERIDPTTERASSTEEALSDHTDPFVEDGLIGLHEVQAADMLDNGAQSGVRKFIAGKWRDLNTERRFDNLTSDERRLRERRDNTFNRPSDRPWQRMDESGSFASPTPKGREAVVSQQPAEFMDAKEYTEWDRYRVRLADAFNDRSGQQVESNQ